MERVEQYDGVGPSGDGNEDMATGWDELAGLNLLKHGAAECMHRAVLWIRNRENSILCS